MVEPLYLHAGGLGVAFALLALPARAGELPSSCRAGLVLGVAPTEAEKVISAICASGSGMLRVSLVGREGGLTVIVTRVVDESGTERSAHASAASIAEAVTLAPALVAEVSPGSARAAPPVAASPVVTAPPPPDEPRPAVTIAPAPAPAADTLPATREAPPPVSKKRTSFVAGLQGGVLSITDPSSRPTSFGGGALIGLEHERVFGYIDGLYVAGQANGVSLSHLDLAMGVRGNLLPTRVTLVLGGGYIYTRAAIRREPYSADHVESGLDVFIDGGVAARIDAHRIGLIGRAAPLGDSQLWAQVYYGVAF